MKRFTKKQKGGEANNNLVELTFNNIKTENIKNLPQSPVLSNNSNNNNNNNSKKIKVEKHNYGNVKIKNYGHHQKVVTKVIEPKKITISEPIKLTKSTINNSKKGVLIKPKLQRSSNTTRKIKINNNNSRK